MKYLYIALLFLPSLCQADHTIVIVKRTDFSHSQIYNETYSQCPPAQCVTQHYHCTEADGVRDRFDRCALKNVSHETVRVSHDH